ncbi:hypothetical protein CRENBAI_016165 [Crenichthys baileyi]|uniref:Leptin n=1 Tax=Crenichthys baileyi TaxID=28760 RepID=A0AAV9QTW0_9TELE
MVSKAIASIISIIRSTCFMPISLLVFTCAMLFKHPSVLFTPCWRILFVHANPSLSISSTVSVRSLSMFMPSSVTSYLLSCCLRTSVLIFPLEMMLVPPAVIEQEAGYTLDRSPVHGSDTYLYLRTISTLNCLIKKLHDIINRVSVSDYLLETNTVM